MNLFQIQKIRIFHIRNQLYSKDKKIKTIVKFKSKIKMEINSKDFIKMESEYQEKWNIVKLNVFIKGLFSAISFMVTENLLIQTVE